MNCKDNCNCDCPCPCRRVCPCPSVNHHSAVCCAAILLLAALVLFFFLPVNAIAGVFSTAVQVIPVGDAAAFENTGPLENITFTAPDTLTVGDNAGGTYLVSYAVNLVGALPAPPPPAPAPAAPGLARPAPAAPAPTDGIPAEEPAVTPDAPVDTDTADEPADAPTPPKKHDPVFGVFVNGVAQISTQDGAIVLDGANVLVEQTAIISIPAGASVTLRNMGPDIGILGNNTGGVTVVSAELNLHRVG